MRFKAKGIDAGTDITFALVVVCPVSNNAVNLAIGKMSFAGGADNGDVEGDSAGFREVVHHDIAWAPVRASNYTWSFVVDDDAGGFEDGAEGVFDVLVALDSEA